MKPPRFGGSTGTMRRSRSTRRSSPRNLVPAHLAAAVGGLIIFGATFVGLAPAVAAECPGNPDALGTSRTLVVDPAEHPRLGSMQYHESLPLEDHEIVLTFDDGPLPPRSTQVLDALDHECVKATFFLIGKMAHNFPDVVRRIHEAGHTIGTHSYSHPLTFHRMSVEKAQFEINQGIASVTASLGDGTGPAPFFRIPGLLRADGVEHYLASQNLQVWSADFLADDWTKIGPGQVYSRALQRIEANHKGILLLHDIQTKTVEALPYLLRELKRRGYKIVQVVPATPEHPKTATDPGQWMMRSHQISRTPIVIEGEPELPAPSPASFGFDVDSNSISFPQRISLIRDPAWQPLMLPEPGTLAPLSTWPSGFEVTRGTPNLSAQFHLPAAYPHSPGYTGERLRPWASKASADVVGEAKDAVAVSEIQRLLESLPEDTAASPDDHGRKTSSAGADDTLPGNVATPPPRGPAANAVMPRGAFP
jgi:peptidoglycan/xylan/chitin deacetylase (PgdA/CDA1 family)